LNDFSKNAMRSAKKDQQNTIHVEQAMAARAMLRKMKHKPARQTRT
jgi:hypothetical protein